MLHYRSIRIVHFWANLFIITPLLIFVITGLIGLFQSAPWKEVAVDRTGQTPSLFFSSMLDTINLHSELEVSDWSDIKTMDVKPGRGTALIVLSNSQSVELDLYNGEIVEVTQYNSDVINGLSDKEQSEFVRLLLIYIVMIGIILIHVFTGIYLFLRPQIYSLRKKKLLAEEALLME